MSRKPATNYGVAPRERVPRQAPRARGIGSPPQGHPMATVSPIARAPREHAAGKPPNPRRPKLVRDVHGGGVEDLFALFPDLPRPARPKGRVPTRVARGRAKQ